MNCQHLLLVFGLAFIFSCGQPEKTPSELIAMVPEKATAVVRINNYEGFKSDLKNNALLQSLGEATVFREGEDLVSSLQYINPKGESLLYFSEIGKDNFEYTLVTENHNDLISIDDALGRTIERISYDNHIINKLLIENKPIFSTSIGKFFIASSSQLPVEDLIRNRSKIRGVKELMRLYTVAQPQASATLFINNKNSRQLLSKVINNETADVFRAMSEWSSLDLEINQELLRGNGIAVAGDSIPNILNRFKQREPGRSKIAEITPAISSYFIGIPNAEGLIKDLTNAKDSLFTDAKEAGFVKLGATEIWTMEFEEDSDLAERLRPFKAAAENYRDFHLITLNNKDIIRDRFGFLKAETDAEFAAIKLPYLFISDSKEGLKDLIANIQNRSVMSNLGAYKNIRTELADASSIELFVNLEALRKNNSILDEDLKKSIKDLNDHKMLALQYIMERDFAHVNLITKKSNDTAVKDHLISQVFNTEVDAPVISRPQFVYNHRTKKKEVVVQDADNGLYLISTEGKVLWKKQLDGPVLGDIQQIDIYRNGRWQLAFNTAGKMYVVDRNGNDVAPFPITPESAITQPLGVFDYDNSKNYRFCLTLNNKSVMYNREARIITGFRMNPTQSPISNTPKHIRIGNKDFIAVKEANGRLHLLHRTGEPRIKIEQNLDLSENDVYHYKNAFTATTRNGDLLTIDSQGTIKRAKKPYESSHKIDATLHTLAAISNNMLYIKDKSIELDYGMYTQPKIFYLYDKLYIAITDKQSHQVYLFDSNGELLKNFPVYGTSLVDMDDIDNDKRVELVTTGDDNSVVVYSLK